MGWGLRPGAEPSVASSGPVGPVGAGAAAAGQGAVSGPPGLTPRDLGEPALARGAVENRPRPAGAARLDVGARFPSAGGGGGRRLAAPRPAMAPRRPSRAA